MKKKAIFLDEENFDILTLLQKKQTIEKKPASPKSFQEPLSIMKSKPLKSEKDRILSQNQKTGVKKPVPPPPVNCKDVKITSTPKVVPEFSELKIEKIQTEIVKAEKTIEMKPVKVKKSVNDETTSQKTVV